MSEDDETFVNPSGAMQGARQLHTAGEGLYNKWSQLTNKIDGLNGQTPWGNDQPGSEFNKNYLGGEAPAKTVLSEGKKAVDRLHDLGTDVASAIDGTVDTDDLIAKWFPKQGK